MFLRAMAILEGPSGLPTDRYVNTFHFHDFASTTADETDKVIVGNLVADAYEELVGVIAAEVTFPEVRVYDMEDPEPREPTIVTPGVASQPTGTGARMPREVALCLSYYGDRNIPRQRGRVYIGPLAVTESTTGDRPPASIQQALIEFGYRLATNFDAEPMKWIVHSPTTNGKALITDLWVDNAWDTMRSRGSEPSERITHEISTGAPTF